MSETSRNLILIGKFVRTRGIRGQLKVLPLTDFPEQFQLLDRIYVSSDKGSEPVKINSVQFIKNLPCLFLTGIDSIEQAEIFIGREIYIEPDQRIVLPEGSYRFEEIDGFEVVSSAGEPVGILKDVMHLPASDVLVIDRKGKEVLIPFVEKLVPLIDKENRLIEVADMPSLWEGDHLS